MTQLIINVNVRLDSSGMVHNVLFLATYLLSIVMGNAFAPQEQRATMKVVRPPQHARVDKHGMAPGVLLSPAQ